MLSYKPNPLGGVCFINFFLTRVNARQIQTLMMLCVGISFSSAHSTESNINPTMYNITQYSFKISFTFYRNFRIRLKIKFFYYVFDEYSIAAVQSNHDISGKSYMKQNVTNDHLYCVNICPNNIIFI